MVSCPFSAPDAPLGRPPGPPLIVPDAVTGKPEDPVVPPETVPVTDVPLIWSAKRSESPEAADTRAVSPSRWTVTAIASDDEPGPPALTHARTD